MTAEARREPVFKWGRGIEFTTEALVALIAQRYPNLLDWKGLAGVMPAFDYVVQMETWGMYFTHIGIGGEPHRDSDVIFQLRRISEGAPIPTKSMRLSNVALEDGTPRCGWYLSQDLQCSLGLGHDGDHLPETLG